MASVTRAQPAPAERPHAEVLAALAAGILGPDATPEIPGRVLATLDQLASRRDRDQLLAILRLLASDARMSLRRIARELGMSPPAITDRVAGLERLGVIRSVVVLPAPFGPIRP